MTTLDSTILEAIDRATQWDLPVECFTTVVADEVRRLAGLPEDRAIAGQSQEAVFDLCHG
ncbi:hypothetical protein [Pseudohaliea sp.]|uniref:hypothetical protein n=1 Tax=Pseudohaliea sp. TaxID=2740289 RepID=UPI0032EBE005